MNDDRLCRSQGASPRSMLWSDAPATPCTESENVRYGRRPNGRFPLFRIIVLRQAQGCRALTSDHRMVKRNMRGGGERRRKMQNKWSTRPFVETARSDLRRYALYGAFCSRQNDAASSAGFIATKSFVSLQHANSGMGSDQARRMTANNATKQSRTRQNNNASPLISKERNENASLRCKPGQSTFLHGMP